VITFVSEHVPSSFQDCSRFNPSHSPSDVIAFLSNKLSAKLTEVDTAFGWFDKD
jgi:hypothetical protein